MQEQQQNHPGKRAVAGQPAEREMSTSPGVVVGIAWYRPERYDQVREVMADGISFPKTHASWRQKAARMERELRRQGMAPVRVEIDPDRFAAWCQDHDAAPDSEARDRFVRETVASRPRE